MIIYQKTKEGFSNDILTNNIDGIISGELKRLAGKRVAPNEIMSFRNSLPFMDKVLQDREIPEDCGISIEYHIPQTSKRVDFIISGSDGQRDNVVIIELKQWSEAKRTAMDGIIETRFHGRSSPTNHPSYQAWSYVAFLNSFNETVLEESIFLQPCAYLHNYPPDNTITHDFYREWLSKAPVFLKPDAVKLRNFIKRFIRYGDKRKTLLRIDKGKLRPSKTLSESLRSMMGGNKEFILIDDQKVVYEMALRLAINSNKKNKRVLIVEGGPGTGKSVVAVNLLVELNKRGCLAQYVTKTSAPREVYFNKLGGFRKMAELKNLFVSSGAFMKTPRNTIPALIVDEAHRLTEKTGFLKMGNNQIREIIDSSLFSVFFIDEDQRVHINDYGECRLIEKFAKMAGARVTKMDLPSQFRCGGSDGYLSWLDQMLQIRQTANETFRSKDFNYDFRVINSPVELRDLIMAQNKENNRARLVAGYCWDWESKNNPEAYDITIPPFDFKMRWNLKSYGPTWIIDPHSVNEIGCIHTCQGLEVDYIGVIIGWDLIFRNGKVLTDPSKRSKDDKSIFGYKKRSREKPDQTRVLLNAIIKNTYRTLMTRGMKGCYVYCMDEGLQDYLKGNTNLSQKRNGPDARTTNYK